jgi:hypothetical protein
MAAWLHSKRWRINGLLPYLVSCLLLPCCLPVLPTLLPCRLPVLPPDLPCCLPVLPTLLPCRLPVLPPDLPCRLPVLPTLLPCCLPVLPPDLPCCSALLTICRICPPLLSVVVQLALEIKDNAPTGMKKFLTKINGSSPVGMKGRLKYQKSGWYSVQVVRCVAVCLPWSSQRLPACLPAPPTPACLPVCLHPQRLPACLPACLPTHLACPGPCRVSWANPSRLELRRPSPLVPCCLTSSPRMRIMS